MTTTAVYELIEMGCLHESILNPRHTYDPAKLQELAASIAAKGIITPLLVRPNAKGYEIAAGHRRYRAGKLAGVATAPCLIRPMDDAEFVEVLNIENLQREDLTPLEEAEGYRLLMVKAGYDAKRIAERVGKSEKYVYDRVKLLQLVPAAKKLLEAGTITAGHAILLARLKAKDQERALDPDERALLTHEAVLEDPDAPEGKRGLADPVKAVSVRELDGWIAQHVRFDAKATDPMVFPETAATLAVATEQAEKVVPITHNHYIQEEAREGRTFGPRSWKRADGKAKSKTCAHAVTGVIVVGPGRGEAFKVCIAKEKCDTHWGAEKRERARRASRGEVGGSQKGRQDSWARDEARRRAEQAKADAEHARWKRALPAILEAVAHAVKKAPTKATGLLAGIILDELRLDWGHKDHSAMVPRGATADDLVRHAAFRILMEAAQEWSAWKEFPKRAKAFGLDVGKIVDQAAPVEKPKAETSAPAKKLAGKKGKKS